MWRLNWERIGMNKFYFQILHFIPLRFKTINFFYYYYVYCFLWLLWRHRAWARHLFIIFEAEILSGGFHNIRSEINYCLQICWIAFSEMHQKFYYDYMHFINCFMFKLSFMYNKSKRYRFSVHCLCKIFI